MNLAKFSKQAFESKGLDTPAARQLADELETIVLEQLHAAASERLRQVIAHLNGLGHDLQPAIQEIAGDVEYRDERGGACRLRLGCNMVVSAGYAHTIQAFLAAQSEE